MRWLVVTAISGILALTTACTVSVHGSATAPTDAPGSATVLVAEDGYGVQLGYPFAPAAIEIYIEPLCPACASFVIVYGAELTDYIENDELVVTYRPLTFLDETGGYSQRVSNALFAAADPSQSEPAEAAAVQDFLWEMFGTMLLENRLLDDAGTARVADEAGLPAGVVDSIAAGEQVVDVEQMNESNSERFEELTGDRPYTPMVYDLNAGTDVDIDPGWLAKVVERS